MKKEELFSEIEKLKKEKDAVILAHNYQREEVQLVADFLGDSLDLSRKAQSVKNRVIVFAGVLFMAETAKILNPEKKVLIPEKGALCPMARQVSPEKLLELKEKYPDSKIVSYINTTIEVKAVSDYICTSSNAVDIVRKIAANRIIFVPDKNLGTFVKEKVPEKEIILYDGFCYVHNFLKKETAEKAKMEHPESLLMVHPEVPKEVREVSDLSLSTGGMIKFAKETDKKSIIVGTEVGIISRLRRENPKKEFIPLSEEMVCKGMKTITLESIYNSLYYERYEVNPSEELIERAKEPLLRMLELSK